MSRTFHPGRFAWALVLVAGSCALPELTVDSRLDPSNDDDGGTAGNNGGSGASGGTSGTDQGGKGGATGGTDGKGGATGGSAGREGCTEPADCGPGNDCCEGSCVNPELDRNHCGDCGTVCPSSQICELGRCTCGTGRTYCAPDCVDTSISVTDCGGCDRPCMADQTCENSRCTGPCGANFAVNSGAWVTAPSASGCWHGYAYFVEQGCTVPTPPVLMDCTGSCRLCMAGTVNPDPAFLSFAMFGVNINQAASGDSGPAVEPQGTSLQISFTNAANSTLRVGLNGPDSDTDENQRWCYEIPTGSLSPLNIPYSRFRINCWQTGGAAYAGEPLESISITVPGHNVNDIPFDACITGLSDI